MPALNVSGVAAAAAKACLTDASRWTLAKTGLSPKQADELQVLRAEAEAMVGGK